MKKLAFMFVAVAAISLASCGNKASQAETAVEPDTVAMEEIVAPVDSAAVEAAAPAAE